SLARCHVCGTSNGFTITSGSSRCSLTVRPLPSMASYGPTSAERVTDSPSRHRTPRGSHNESPPTGTQCPATQCELGDARALGAVGQHGRALSRLVPESRHVHSSGGRRTHAGSERFRSARC